jgi:LmbE family N-acetylglucosaminyl deacetylase
MHSRLKLVCVVAHPDDETLALGGTIAKYASEGVEVSLILATRGERGWFGNWDDYPGEQALGAIREKELRAACDILGVAHLEFLGYLDGSVDQSDGREIIRKLVRLLREIRPQVVVTFGPEGLYGHPDHIAISQWTTSALVGAGDARYPGVEELEPHRIAKLYYRTGTAEWFEHYTPLFGDLIMHIDGRERRATPWQPWIITTRLDTRAYWQQVWDAVHCHQTQLRYRHKLQDVTEWLQLQLWGQQEYYRVLSLVNGGREEEHDLFEGLRPAQYALS